MQRILSILATQEGERGIIYEQSKRGGFKEGRDFTEHMLERRSHQSSSSSTEAEIFEGDFGMWELGEIAYSI